MPNNCPRSRALAKTRRCLAGAGHVLDQCGPIGATIGKTLTKLDRHGDLADLGHCLTKHGQNWPTPGQTPLLLAELDQIWANVGQQVARTNENPPNGGVATFWQRLHNLRPACCSCAALWSNLGEHRSKLHKSMWTLRKPRFRRPSVAEGSLVSYRLSLRHRWIH